MIIKSKPASIIVFTFLLISLVSWGFVFGASAQTTLVKAEASASQPHVGDTLTVNVKISDAQNLYGVDVTLNWNPSALKLISATPQLGVESYSNGVLHESSAYPVDVEVNSQTGDGEYHLLATSTGSSTPSFSGSGTIVTLQFNVTNAGATGLALDVELSQRTSDGQVSLVEPSTTVDSVNTVIPEFPVITVVVGLAIAAGVTILIATKLRRPRPLNPTKNSNLL
jgi:hypothetical protein